MATFPTAADMKRPTFGAEAGGYRVARAADLGTEGAQTAYEQGQRTAQLGTALDTLGRELDTAAAQEGINQLRTKRQELTYDPEKGFRALKGGDVMKPGPDGKPLMISLPDGFRTVSDEIAGKLISPGSRALFQRAAVEEQRLYKHDMAVHFAHQTEVFEVGSYKDGQKVDLAEAAQAYGDPAKIEAIAARIGNRALAFSQRRGLPGEGEALAARSNVYRVGIEALATSGDTAGALARFDAWKGKLDGPDLIALAPTMKTLRIGETAKFQAGEMLSGVPTTAAAEEGTKKSLQFWGADGYSEKVSAGITAGFLRESQFFPGARNPKDGRDGSDSVNIGQWNAARAIALAKFARDNGLDPNAVETGLKYAKAEIDGVIPYSVSGLKPEFKERLKNAKSEQEAADIMTRGYFRPLYQDGESAHRQKSATQILAKYGKPADPLQAGVDAATGVAPPTNGSQYRDTRKMLLDADLAYDTATRRNNEINAADDAQRRATQHQLDINLSASKRQIEIAKLNLELAVDQWMTTGGANGTAATQRPPPEIWNQLHYEKQKSIDATLAHNAKGQDVVTDQQAWYEIQKGLSSDDPVERGKWASAPLWEYKSKLSNSDFQELAKMQGIVRKGDPEKQMTHVRGINQMVDDALLNLKIDSTPKPGSTDAEKAAKFRRAVQDQISAIERDSGKKATIEQQQKVIDSMAIEVVTRKGTFRDSTKNRYEMTIKDVPDAEKAKITEALKRAGTPVTDDIIIELFARKNAKAPK